jgi:NADH-quinone oxidoreductase subunit J
VIVLGGLAAVLVVLIVLAPIVTTSINAQYPIDPSVGNSQAIGMVLFTKYLVPFELAAVMLLVAMIAGIVLAGKKMDKSLTLMAEEEIALMQTASIHETNKEEVY